MEAKQGTASLTSYLPFGEVDGKYYFVGYKAK